MAPPLAHYVDQAGRDSKLEEYAEKAEAQYPAHYSPDDCPSQAHTQSRHETDPVGAGHYEPAEATDHETDND